MDDYRAIAADFDGHSRFIPVIPAKAGIQMIAAKPAIRNQA